MKPGEIKKLPSDNSTKTILQRTKLLCRDYKNNIACNTSNNYLAEQKSNAKNFTGKKN